MYLKISGTAYQYLAGLICQLSAAVVGSAFVFFEPLTLRLEEGGVEGISFSSEEISWLVAIVEVGCLIGPPIGSQLANRIGRRPVILLTGPMCLLSWLLLLFFHSLPVFIFIRLVQGVAIGIVFTVTPIYTAEIAEPKHRGRISGLFNVFWYLGVLYSFLVGHYLSFNFYILACLLPPLLFIASFIKFPETPYYLLMKERSKEAHSILGSFREEGNVEEEFSAMETSVKEEMEVENSWRALFCDPGERSAFIILQIVSVSKFMTGMPTIVNYATETFSHGGGMLNPGEMTIVLGSLLCVIGVFSAFLSDYIGRRCLLLLSCYGVFLSHLLTGAYYFLEEATSEEASSYLWLMYVGLTGYCFFSDIGLGPLMQTLQAEMFGAKTRGLAAGITEAAAAVLSFGVLKAYRPVSDTFGVYLNFWFYSGVGLLGGLLLTCLMFETNGKVIGKMEKKIMLPKPEFASVISNLLRF